MLLGVLVAASRLDAADPAELVVAADGSGSFKTVQAAIDAAPAGAKAPVVIRIKNGTYKEKLHIGKEKSFLRLVGEDRDKTILTFDDGAKTLGPDGKELGTFRSPSTMIEADDFSAFHLRFENTANREQLGQAVALGCTGDRAIFEQCAFAGNQDTLFSQAGRQYYRDCLILGGVDFIFGNATAYFENCEIRSIGAGYLTAQSRTKPDDATGYFFRHCTLTAAPDVKPASVYLGRPWRDYARVLFLECAMGAHIRPAGWHNWNNPPREKTATFAEYKSTGPGGDISQRVPWSAQLSDEQAKAFTPEAVLAGKDHWMAWKK